MGDDAYEEEKDCCSWGLVCRATHEHDSGATRMNSDSLSRTGPAGGVLLVGT